MFLRPKYRNNSRKSYPLAQGEHDSERSYSLAQEKGDPERSLSTPEENGCCGIEVWHVIAAILHGVSFLFLLGLYLGNGENAIKGILVNDTFVFDEKDIVLERVAEYDLALVLLPMPALTSLFHIIQAVLSRDVPTDQDLDWFENLQRRYMHAVKRGVNIVRWLEYSITAGLMTWIIAQLSGITNVYLTVLLAAVGNVTLQCHGYLHERFFMDDKLAYKNWTNWIPFINGFVIFGGQWSILLAYFISTVNASGDSGVPWFVWVSFIGLISTFLSFPFVQILYARRWLGVKNWFQYELAFIILSMVSKLLLDWTLFAGIITEREQKESIKDL